MEMRHGNSGFTAIELLIVLSIVAILGTIGLPSMRSTTTSVRMSGEINALIGALNRARSEAVKRGQSVSVCPVNGTSCASGTDWSSGWQVLLNSTPTQQLQLSSGVTHGEVMTVSTGTTPAYPQFTPSGYTFFTGTISLHDMDSTQRMYRCIVFNAGSWTTRTGSSCP
jgi:type IV fimbrial biogenesis protein FimT